MAILHVYVTLCNGVFLHAFSHFVMDKITNSTDDVTSKRLLFTQRFLIHFSSSCTALLGLVQFSMTRSFLRVFCFLFDFCELSDSQIHNGKFFNESDGVGLGYRIKCSERGCMENQEVETQPSLGHIAAFVISDVTAKFWSPN